MNNPLMGMMGGMGGNPTFGKIREFASLVGKRDPRQMVLNLMKQKGISGEELDEAVKQAQEIARMMGLR
jgi:hypothetical protein